MFVCPCPVRLRQSVSDEKDHDVACKRVGDRHPFDAISQKTPPPPREPWAQNSNRWRCCRVEDVLLDVAVVFSHRHQS